MQGKGGEEITQARSWQATKQGYRGEEIDKGEGGTIRGGSKVLKRTGAGSKKTFKARGKMQK